MAKILKLYHVHAIRLDRGRRTWVQVTAQPVEAGVAAKLVAAEWANKTFARRKAAGIAKAA